MRKQTPLRTYALISDIFVADVGRKDNRKRGGKARPLPPGGEPEGGKVLVQPYEIPGFSEKPGDFIKVLEIKENLCIIPFRSSLARGVSSIQTEKEGSTYAYSIQVDCRLR